MGPKHSIFWKVYALDTLFIFLSIFLTSLFTNSIYSLVVSMQDTGSLLSMYDELDQENLDVNQISELTSLVGQLDMQLENLIVFLVSLVFILFFLYVFLQSLGWYLLLSHRLLGYRKFLLKFFLLSFLSLLLLIPLFYFILIYSRTFLLSFLFESLFLMTNFLFILFFGLLFLFVIYLTFTGYMYLQRFSFTVSLKKIFIFKKFWLFFVFVVLSFVSFFIVRYGLFFSTSVFFVSVLMLILSFLFTSYKYYLVKKLYDF